MTIRPIRPTTVVLIEDKASGTELIQELITDGCHAVTRYQPTGDKTMRLHSQTVVCGTHRWRKVDFELSVPGRGEVTAALRNAISGGVRGTGSGAAVDRAFSCSACHSMEPGAHTVLRVAACGAARAPALAGGSIRKFPSTTWGS